MYWGVEEDGGRGEKKKNIYDGKKKVLWIPCFQDSRGNHAVKNFSTIILKLSSSGNQVY